jgi:hypothetical protein
MKVASLTTPLLSPVEPRGEEKSDLGGPVLRRQSSVVAGTSISVNVLLQKLQLQADHRGPDSVPIPEFEGFRYLVEVSAFLH